MPDGSSTINPFPPGTFDGEIVVCDRGTYGRVAKGRNVMEGGAGGYVLANDEANGDSLVGDPHVLLGVHITYPDGLVLKAWLASGSDHRATISGMSTDTSAANGDVMASFSSRGPNPSVPDILKPDITAPGVDILAAFNTVDPTAPPEYGIISGTSMSSPHNAGAAALLRAVHPEWTPDEVRSAMVTTGFTTTPGTGDEVHGVLEEDGDTPADPFDMGGGRVDLRSAGRAGLVLDETASNYEAAARRSAATRPRSTSRRWPRPTVQASAAGPASSGAVLPRRSRGARRPRRRRASVSRSSRARSRWLPARRRR